MPHRTKPAPGEREISFDGGLTDPAGFYIYGKNDAFAVYELPNGDFMAESIPYGISYMIPEELILSAGVPGSGIEITANHGFIQCHATAISTWNESEVE